MKVVIIGGGIAGLSMGISLLKKNTDVVICERHIGINAKGHAFLMHDDGLSLLQAQDGPNDPPLAAKRVKEFSLRRPNNTELKHLKLDHWHCVKRADLIYHLSSLFPADLLKKGREFSHFEYEGDKAVAAVFKNGEKESGDIFIGADGGNSKVRNELFGAVDFTPVEVREVVGIAKNEQLAALYKNTFTKFQDRTKGLAFGFIPTSNSEFVWFMQYDTSISDISNYEPEDIKAFCFELMDEFPEVVKQVLSSNDFSLSYVWDTRDFDLLPAFHKNNVALIGDAAHLSLPFTSAGTTNAIIDAQTLVENIGSFESFEDACNDYYKKRAEDIVRHINQGRELKQLFLKPNSNSDDEIPVPLIPKRNSQDTPDLNTNKPIQVVYFTDPICSTCWIVQPMLRKLKLEYDKYIHIDYCMGGLLPSWKDYNKGKINTPNDAAKHWEEVCATHDMPLDGDVWIEDPLPSSFPPSVAFKAAQMQDEEKAILFLRRIKEMVFLEKKNIIKWQHLREAAYESGLDSARLYRDSEGKAKQLFEQDLLRAQKAGVTGFPTLIFSDGKQENIVVKGLQPYEVFEEIVHRLLPAAEKDNVKNSPEKLFSFFPTMTEKEFIYLGNFSRDSASHILNDMFNSGTIEKYESKNGTIWKSTQPV